MFKHEIETVLADDFQKEQKCRFLPRQNIVSLVNHPKFSVARFVWKIVKKFR